MAILIARTADGRGPAGDFASRPPWSDPSEVAATQGVAEVFRHLPVDFVALGIHHDAPSEPSESRARTPFRRAKLVAALAVAALVGAGSYTATYRALVIISTPSALAPIHAPGPTTAPTSAALLARSGA